MTFYKVDDFITNDRLILIFKAIEAVGDPAIWLDCVSFEK